MDPQCSTTNGYTQAAGHISNYYINYQVSSILMTPFVTRLNLYLTQTKLFLRFSTGSLVLKYLIVRRTGLIQNLKKRLSHKKNCDSYPKTAIFLFPTFWFLYTLQLDMFQFKHVLKWWAFYQRKLHQPDTLSIIAVSLTNFTFRVKYCHEHFIQRYGTLTVKTDLP